MYGRSTAEELKAVPVRSDDPARSVFPISAPLLPVSEFRYGEPIEDDISPFRALPGSLATGS